mmetsp:Transcript_5990/g.18925  ORF Transcript_5990/g.18925 Transcript_5990/m.18925 type:complete len:382 (-) Transcript_5990:203-1348(-)
MPSHVPASGPRPHALTQEILFTPGHAHGHWHIGQLVERTSMLGAELRLRDAGGHDSGRGEAGRDDVAHLVDDLGAAPLLVRQGLHAHLALLTLDELHVGRRATLRVVAGEQVDGQGIAMEARQRDELPAEAELGEVPDEGLHLGIGHAAVVPVEGGAQVVGEHLVGSCGADLLSELRCLAQDGLAGLHPDAIRIGGEGDGTLDAELRGALDPEVALHGAGDVPIEKQLDAHGRGGLAHLRKTHLQGVGEPLGGIRALGLQSLGHRVREGHATGTLLPVLVFAALDGLPQRLDTLHGDALDVRVVDGVDVGVDHGRGLRVGARHDDERRVEDVRLQADRDQTLRVLPSGHQDLATHVSALLGARLLVLDVDARGAVLDEHLR